ncbi:PhnE/PtxC family ABC transporter permease [Bifidobacterium simiiventris]|uniref:PhnE/PtxC family ABC transporter permease n=1 Tax=Bifidobacterium simiiventris TaxID=2834434 RepID=UPI001C59B171|nr:ABC transporter permease subunit [Bifidobacterium simiiventris]MBW3077783.1 ABC transporter permease subunit [Bifidobacterium simiiventris]
MNDNITITSPATIARRTLAAIALIAVFAVSLWGVGLDIGKFTKRLGNFGSVARRMIAFAPAKIPEIVLQTLISISLAFAALVIGALIAYVLATFAARNTTPCPILAAAIKAVIAVIRAVPMLVWVLIVVAAVGFGNTGGVIGLLFPTVGYLTRSFVSALEEDGDRHIEALKATGARWHDITLKGVTQSVMPKLIAWVAICFETDVAAGISLGMLGVTGVGSMLNKAIMRFDYAEISTIIVVVYLTMMLFEALSLTIRKAMKTD